MLVNINKQPMQKKICILCFPYLSRRGEATSGSSDTVVGWRSGARLHRERENKNTRVSGTSQLHVTPKTGSRG